MQEVANKGAAASNDPGINKPRCSRCLEVSILVSSVQSACVRTCLLQPTCQHSLSTAAKVHAGNAPEIQAAVSSVHQIPALQPAILVAVSCGMAGPRTSDVLVLYDLKVRRFILVRVRVF